MRVETDGWTAEGGVVDCRARAVSVAALVEAIARGPLAGAQPSASVRVACERPGPVFEHVGAVTASTVVSPRSALAAAARSRGVDVDERSALAAARADLAAVEVPEVDVAAARERVAAARDAEATVHEDVAAARGMVRARADLDAAVETGRERLRAAVATASERETERVAAEQALARERERAREARDARSRRLELADRVGRLERAVRAALVDAVWPAFEAAVAAVPGGRPGVVGSVPGTYDGDDVTAALAVARVAATSTPVVVAAERFGVPARARDVLGSPVILASN